MTNWASVLTGNNEHVSSSGTKKGPLWRAKDLLAKLPKSFTSSDVMKFYSFSSAYRYTDLMVKLRLVKKEYKRLPTNGNYCVFTKI
jgi:hypothetical protein